MAAAGADVTDAFARECVILRRTAPKDPNAERHHGNEEHGDKSREAVVKTSARAFAPKPALLL